MAYSPSPPFSAPHLSSLLRSSSSAALLEEQDKYFSVLLAERHKLSPFMHVLPHTYRLLNQGEFHKLCFCHIIVLSSSKIVNFCCPVHDCKHNK
uniref:Uncharacterized protein n=1 Tax=Rhizophora mucronata TaxID=61149 RepID=A0A2P2LYA7_RHIMU